MTGERLTHTHIDRTTKSKREREREREKKREREVPKERERERWRKKYGDAKMVPCKAKRCSARVGETGRHM